MSLRNFCLIASSLFVLLVPGSVFAVGWGSGSSKPTMKKLIPKMNGAEAYSERYGLAVDIDGGGHVGMDFTISNLGWGDGHGAVEVRVNMPDQKKYKFFKKVEEDEWSYSKSSFKLTIAGTTIEQQGNNAFRLRHDGAAKVDLVFTNKMPMWRPGNGRLTNGSDFYEFNLIAPRADVKGTVVVNGKTYHIDTKGAGYGEHVATNVAPFDLAKRFSRMRHYNGDVFVIWREIKFAKSFGGKSKSVTWVMVGYKDKIIFSDSNATMREGRIKQDAKSGYRFPMSIQIDGKRGKDSIKLVMKGRRHKRRDLMAGYGQAAKMVAGAFAKPIQFRVNMEYTLQMTVGGQTAQVKGKSNYVLDNLNQ